MTQAASAPSAHPSYNLVDLYSLGAYQSLYEKGIFNGASGFTAASHQPIEVKPNGHGLDIKVFDQNDPTKVLDHLHVDRERSDGLIRVRRKDTKGRRQLLAEARRIQYFGE